jgi:hypothetical protein
MSSPVTPMIALGVTSYVNNWYNTGNATDVKPLLFAGIAGLLLTGFAAIPGAAPVATAVGWTAFIGMLITPIQNPSPAENLLKLTGGKLWVMLQRLHSQSSVLLWRLRL